MRLRTPFRLASAALVRKPHLARQGLLGIVKAAIFGAAFRWFEKRGYAIGNQGQPGQAASRSAFFAAERAARLRYDALDEQTKSALPFELNAKYEQTFILGKIRLYDAVALLANVIDPLDPYLGCVSQLTHQLQLATAMEQDGMDEQLVFCALIHDLGKLLIGYGDEDPINVEASGAKTPLRGNYGDGLLKCTFRWDHGDFAYLRIKDHVPPEVSWLVRHHAIDIAAQSAFLF